MKLADGKYEIKREGDRVIALRYGEPWRDLTGDNLIYHLMARIEELDQDNLVLWTGKADLQARIEELEPDATAWRKLMKTIKEQVDNISSAADSSRLTPEDALKLIRRMK